MIGMARLLSLVAQATHPRTAANKSVVKEELAKCNKWDGQIERKVKLFVQLIEESLEVRECHRKSTINDVIIGDEHPFSKDRTNYQYKREKS